MQIDLRQAVLRSSNPSKLEEFRSFGLDSITVAPGEDLPEVKSTCPFTVILYKALAAGANNIVEDTSLQVEGAEIGTEIRWLLPSLHLYAGRRAVWQTLVAFNDGATIHTAIGETAGSIVDPGEVPADAFAFDPYFIPDGTSATLYALKKAGQKDAFSARRNALINLVAGDVTSTPMTEIQPWTGDYQ